MRVREAREIDLHENMRGEKTMYLATLEVIKKGSNDVF